jgi:hypothetical protein
LADKDAADPEVFWFSVGTSPAWMADITTFVPLPRKYEPDVTAPAKVLIAPCAVVVPEPPLATATIPETLDAVPVVFWLPAVFTPGRLMFAVPSKDTPPMVLAV